MNRVLLLLLLTTLSFSTEEGSDFQLIIPSKVEQEKLPKTTRHKSLSYRYLEHFYSSDNPVDSVQYYEGSKDTCGFTQVFDQNIEYRTFSFFAIGQDQQITFPKTDQKLVKKWIETLFEVPENNWINDNTYGPPGVGCSYTIIQTTSRTVVRIYCGC